jgi:DNA-binding CsgD family transcriptional regulator
MGAIVRAPALCRMSNGYSIDHTARMGWPLVGREAELRLVDDALSAGTTGGVVIAGPAGVGKTRLATEIARRAEPRGCEVAWVRATGSAASVPLGAFAQLLSAADVRVSESVELLTRARRALVERAAGRRLVLCVDDGQLLDDASATLVHQVVAAGEAFAAVTVRSDEPAPDAMRALWKDELCTRLELGALSREEVDVLLASALGAPADGATVTALWKRTRGNALFLRELVRHGLDGGLLADEGGVWRWRGRVEGGARLAELVDLRIDGLRPPARDLLELVAVGGPLELGLLPPDAAGAMEELERSELVVRRTDGRRRFVDVAHPLHGEAVRARLTATRLDAIHAQLADALEASGIRRGGDLLRLATWRLEAGATGHGVLFGRAAFAALGAHDHALAERLARAAMQADAGFDAELALGRALAASGHGAEADRVLAGLAQLALDDRERAAVALARARNLFWGLDRAGDADTVLQEAERRMAGEPHRHELAAQRARLSAGHGRPEAALAAARPLLEDEAVSERARITAAIGAVEALFSTGRTDESLALADAWLPAARRFRAELPHAEVVLLGMRAMALRLGGRLVEATTQSEAAYRLLLERRSAPATAVEAHSLGFIWVARGRVRTALRLCRESAALLREGDPVGMRAAALAGAAQAAAQAGEADAARSAVTEMEGTPLSHKGFALELALARAWSAAATGELSRARALAAEAAARARDRGQDAYAVRALHELCRLGDPVTAAPQLAELAGRVDGPFAPTAAAHATALVGGDGAALMAAAESLADQDALLVAVEAAEAAATAHRGAGRQASARAAAARAGLWLSKCEDARPPTLPASREAADLTPREREIALLAAAGSSSREIADRLVLSVRTVDNHLQNAYRKLGVRRREDLAQAL